MHLFKVSQKNKTITYHVIGWCLFFLYDTGFPYYISGRMNPIADMLFFNACNICIFYCHYYLLTATLAGRRPRYLKAVLFVCVELLFFTGIKSCWELYRLPGDPILSTGFTTIKPFIVVDLVRSIYYAGLATLAWAAGHIANLRHQAADAAIRELEASRDKASLEAQLAGARNAYLQQQLNPHLLFNTLNFIYNAVYQNSPEGAEVVLLLADIMRFSMEETGPDGKIDLQREIGQLHNLIAINRSRFHYPLRIDLHLQKGEEPYRIIPLILLTLIENMFKHGDFKDKDAMIRLTVSDTGLLHLETRNAKRPVRTDRRTGLGWRIPGYACLIPIFPPIHSPYPRPRSYSG
jgi:two-component system LytT family sensor kinase